jgi:hypothetical protein
MAVTDATLFAVWNRLRSDCLPSFLFPTSADVLWRYRRRR